MTDTKAEIARRWVDSTEGLQHLFEAEIRNEANGGVRPSTLSSTIDSVAQMPEDILAGIVGDVDDVLGTLTALLMVRDLLPGSTPVEGLVT